jgi:hypothetical protein
MSGFEAILPFAMQAANMAVGAITSNARESSQANYQQALYEQQQAQMQAQTQAQLEQLKASQEAETADRQRKLKAALASQRAAFGASGLETASSGSANAVLRGLAANAADDQAQSDKAYSLRANAIGQNYNFATQRNLLEQSRQFSGSSNGLGLISQGVGLAGGLLKSLL